MASEENYHSVSTQRMFQGVGSDKLLLSDQLLLSVAKSLDKLKLEKSPLDLAMQNS